MKVKSKNKIRTVIRIYISLHSTATGRHAPVKDERPIQTALRLYGIRPGMILKLCSCNERIMPRIVNISQDS